MNLKSVMVISGLGVQSMVLVAPMQEHTLGHCPRAAWSTLKSSTAGHTSERGIFSVLFFVIVLLWRWGSFKKIQGKYRQRQKMTARAMIHPRAPPDHAEN